MTATEFRVPVTGGEIVGHVHGDHGPDIMLLSSIGLGELFWWRTAQKLAENARVVTLAVRGHGRSTCEMVRGETIDALHDLVAVADHLGMERPAVIGYEFGAAVGALTARLFPERFAAVGIVDAPMILTTEQYTELVSIFEDDDLQAMLAARAGLGANGPDEASMTEFLDTMSAQMASDWNGLNPDAESTRASLINDILVEPSGAWVRRPTIETCATYADVPDDFFARPGRELLGSLSVPVWVLHLTDGRYTHGFEEFQEYAAGRESWDVRSVAGGTEHFHDGALADEITQLLSTLPV